ncbi:uncharacterized protein LOC123515596 isoform X1 [Portunus trituberculatus]|uniref:uncharacterized protein LOC123515596 isoform X1 n=1 Tax=Portunus trituberculatus TaxID=210409 RepID=UPI001E1CB693|nr:uncharacterized protein LOC123515596 isoform X1 [Portunus trituberculatus]XP_045130304.1 uncharacterized protein LOC123515596 isoform X1 [Portunus trituberculatus]XP_045130305.1 uncharacterized protein LOC123515596 isoform X1 [Portunus trituberculatus]XP_045130306.1 uncharacterized protein LOC123515596 isoform X1 [Portunus trituberculatus]
MVYLHLQRLQLVVVALISLATARDRWVWSGQRSSRHLVRVFSPFLPPPFLRPTLLPSVVAERTSSRQTRKPKVVEAPDAADRTATVPSRPTARGVTQDSLVVHPLPLDISKLPLETSGSDGFQEVFAPHPAAALRSSDQHLALALPGEQQLTTFQQDTATPSLQTKTGHVEALVATPDISQLPLQSPSSSSSFETSSFSNVGPAAPREERPSPSSDAVVFPVKILEKGTVQRTVPPPSSTPVPTRIFLRGFTALDDTPFLRSDRLEEKRILKTLEALQKESLASQNSRNIKLAIQNLKRLAEDLNTVSDEDRVVFPKFIDIDSVGSESRHEALQVIEPPRFGGVRKDSKPLVFTLPALQPQTSSPIRDTHRPEGSLAKRLDTEAGTPLTAVFNEPKVIRGGRKVPPYAWLWPGETSTIAISKIFHQPASHAL